MATLLQDDFSARADGPMGVSTSGHAWAVTGDPALGLMGIHSGAATLNNTGVNGYAQVISDGVPGQIAVTWSFTAPNFTFCLMSHREEVFQGLNIGMHLVVTLDDEGNGAIDVQLRQTDFLEQETIFESLGDGPFPLIGLAPYINIPLGLVVTINDETISVDLPLGGSISVTDPRIPQLVGHKIVIQSKRESASDGLVKWLTIAATGEPGQPEEIPPVENEEDPDPEYPESQAYATIEDVQNRYEQELDPALWRLVNTRLGDAEMLLRSRIPNLDDRLELAPVNPDFLDIRNLKRVEAEMVLRLIRNPEGYSQESDGNYSYAIYQQVASGKLEVTSEEWSLLGVGSGMWVLAPSLMDPSNPTVIVDPALAWGINVPKGWQIGGPLP